MWEALILLNPYGREAGRRKLKNRQKMYFFVFLGCFCAYVGQSHDHISWATSMPFTSINPTNPRTNPWNFHKNCWELAILKNSVVLSWSFWNYFFFQKNFFLLHPQENQSKLLGYQEWVEILMITLVYSKRVSVRNNLLHNVHTMQTSYRNELRT